MTQSAGCKQNKIGAEAIKVIKVALELNSIWELVPTTAASKESCYQPPSNDDGSGGVDGE